MRNGRKRPQKRPFTVCTYFYLHIIGRLTLSQNRVGNVVSPTSGVNAPSQHVPISIVVLLLRLHDAFLCRPTCSFFSTPAHIILTPNRYKGLVAASAQMLHSYNPATSPSLRATAAQRTSNSDIARRHPDLRDCIAHFQETSSDCNEVRYGSITMEVQ